jgi:hypothetical protein
MKTLFSTVLCVALLSGCAATPPPTTAGSTGDKPGSATDAVGQSTLPPGAIFRPERSLIIGSGDQWVGRVVADTARDAEAAFRFFVESYPAQGWTLISSVRGKTSLLVFIRKDRTATVELVQGGPISAGSLVLTITSRNSTVGAPMRP